MALKKHHKILIGGFSSLVIIFMICSGILIYVLYSKVNIQYTQLNQRMDISEAEIFSKLNELTISIQENRETISTINDSFKDEISLLKSSTSSDFSGIIEDAVKSVVTIRTDVAQGTGFIISEDGYVVTNAHILSGGRQLYVVNYEQDNLDVDLVGYDLDLDIALLKLENGMYDKLDLADSSEVQVGQKVIAIGNPLGLQFSVSEGIVSAVHREGTNGIDAYIQTDAALNPGNSGGPLIDKSGKIIGINNFKIGSGESLGFALESDYIKEVVNSISIEEIDKILLN